MNFQTTDKTHTATDNQDPWDYFYNDLQIIIK